MVGPRIGRFAKDGKEQDTSVSAMSSPVTALTGMCMLWWSWLSFNCGSTFGVTGDLWRLATKVAVTTVNSSIGGSMAGLLMSIIINRNRIFFDVSHQINSILGGLVAITAGCSVFGPAESLLIGFIGGSISIVLGSLLERLRIDDPVGVIPVHMFTGIWALLAVGLFRRNNPDLLITGWTGIVFGGSMYYIGVQALGVVLLATWSIGTSFLAFAVLKHTIGIRMDEKNEILGSDWVEHQVRSENFAMNLEKKVETLKNEQGLKTEVAIRILDELATCRRKSSCVDYGILNLTGPSMTPSRAPSMPNSRVPSIPGSREGFVGPDEARSGQGSPDSKRSLQVPGSSFRVKRNNLVDVAKRIDAIKELQDSEESKKN